MLVIRFPVRFRLFRVDINIVNCPNEDIPARPDPGQNDPSEHIYIGTDVSKRSCGGVC